MINEQFWALLEPEHSRAEGFCRQLAGSRDEGDDLYQDTLVAALTKFESLRDAKAFRPWLYRIIVNTYKNRHRQPWWRLRRDVSQVEFEAAVVDDPSNRYEAIRWLKRAFLVLKPNERALICLYELEDWNITELTQLYNVPDGTLKSRLSRARKKMRQEISRILAQTDRTANNREADHGFISSK